MAVFSALSGSAQRLFKATAGDVHAAPAECADSRSAMFRRLAIALSLLAPLPAAAAFVALGLPGSQLTAIADDGRSAAGSMAGAASGGFHWRQDAGSRRLPDAVSVNGISPSGRYVVGSSLDRNADEVATWWDVDAVAHRIDGAAPSVGRAISDAGELIGIAGADGGARKAFRWSAAEGVRRLDDTTLEPRPARCALQAAPEATAPPAEYAAASRDGALRVGHAGSGAERRTIVWTAQNGAQRLDAFLATHGVEVPRDWVLLAATAVDPDARHIGGYGLHRRRFDSFVAELPPDVRILCDPSAPSGIPPSQEITP